MSNWAISTSTDESITPRGGMTKAAHPKRIAQRKLATAIASFIKEDPSDPLLLPPRGSVLDTNTI